MDAMISSRSNSEATLRERVIEENGTRVLVIEPANGADAALPAALRERVDAAKRQFGGVLLRGFAPLDAGAFNAFTASFGKPLLSYEFASTPRSRIEKDVYSSTEYPADQWIDQHNEQSYTLKWPGSIWFYCDIAAATGGSTPVADSRLVYRRLDPALRRRFAEHGVMYVRNYGNGLDVPWEQVFGTEDRAEVERYCRANRIDYEWLDDGEALRTRQVCQSELRHPLTDEMVWFNQAHLFHVSGLPDAVREALLEVVDEDRLPRNTLFGDGSPIDASMLGEIRAVYRDTMLAFPWQAGDALVLDNLLMSHGRAPFSGKRRVLVAMSA
ncbi:MULTISPECIES: TauD/TfdA family dioxygenase [unclassified Caballeronia]|uniref:TauD/TfdA family dioxygenase n=1 Tax=unclassified Caballeronia TaxID=2646786 RepID=UPI00285C4773|nr:MULTISPECIES: TauD/TfdA family dioxygenase [unclassified Caballeronia]MDR5776829.1 TauD/TfdA family dioxygenase [Caballeronia sp. LZ002]MDR5798688.1 TauD/TfdA family dioxygenase [Caballeronia sp. LZ001]MDR5852269.1 TauD/TfdA family dioxygenase [Caballeronia sp. LZ003]